MRSFNIQDLPKQNLKQEEYITIFKDKINRSYQYLTEGFKAGENIEILTKKQVSFIDEILIKAWSIFIQNDDYALVAVGGYGREELSLYSDIDLLIIEKKRLSANSQLSIEKFLVFLWDCGLEIGHSVRTIRECQLKAKQDITIITNIMESRILCGNKKLYEDMLRKITPNKIWPVQKYFIEKSKEQKARHKKYNQTIYKLEPNIKESRGGLRDIQMISWVTKRYFDNINLQELIKHNFLTKNEYKILTDSQNLLCSIRFALHMLNKRREDRLLFSTQLSVAKLLGFNSYKKDNSDVEKFMKMYFKTTSKIARLNEMLLQFFEEEIIYKKRKEKIVYINSRFQKRNEYIETVAKDTFKKHPSALLEIFLLIQKDKNIKSVKANTIRSIRDNLHLIDDDFRQNTSNQNLFMKIIKQPRLVGHKLRMMHCYGVLGAYIPAFAKIEGLMQYDMFHIYTVDEHILTVIKHLRLFNTYEYRDKFKLCGDIVKKIPKLELLYLAGMFHDIAKGRNGDHSKLGAKDALNFCKLHGLTKYEAKLVGWLVEKHLLMSKTIQRENIEDPDVINVFAKTVGDQTCLNYLYLLTVADIYSTNHVLWNSWKDTLLSNLYHNALRKIRIGKEKPVIKVELVKDIKIEVLLSLRKSGFVDSQILHYFKFLTKEYFIRNSIEEITWQITGIITNKKPEEPLVLVKPSSSRGSSLIFIYLKNKDKIFALTTLAIEQLGLNILDAKIITLRNAYVLDTYSILEKDGGLIKTKSRAREIETKIKSSLLSTDRFLKHDHSLEKIYIKSFNIPTQINFEHDGNNNRTIMEVITIDRVGVLSRIGEAMSLCGVRLLGAKIATFGERVEDIFYLRDKNNEAITDPIKFECLEKTIIEFLT